MFREIEGNQFSSVCKSFLVFLFWVYCSLLRLTNWIDGIFCNLIDLKNQQANLTAKSKNSPGVRYIFWKKDVSAYFRWFVSWISMLEITHLDCLIIFFQKRIVVAWNVFDFWRKLFLIRIPQRNLSVYPSLCISVCPKR